MTLTVQKLETAATPPAALILLGLFCTIIGIYYLINNRRRVRKWWRKTTRRKDFWGYVLAGVLFFGFSAFFIFLDFRY